ncbi:hypothetical protein EV122DRAFT_268797, partial [Schizophyllum commune]
MAIPLFFPPHKVGAASSYARRPSDKAREGEDLQLRPFDVVGAFLGDATLARRLYVTDIYLYEERELPMHEFLRVDFYDRCTGMCNCIFVERAAPAQTLAEEADNAFLRTFACFFAGGEAADSFIIPCRRSYTRRPRQLAEKQYRLLQSLHPPPEQPFTLEELSVICDVVSQKYPEYKSLTSQCFWYARSVLGIVASSQTPSITCTRPLSTLPRGGTESIAASRLCRRPARTTSAPSWHPTSSQLGRHSDGGWTTVADTTADRATNEGYATRRGDEVSVTPLRVVL